MNTKVISAVAGGLVIGAAAFIPIGGSAELLPNTESKTTSSDSPQVPESEQVIDQSADAAGVDSPVTGPTTSPASVPASTYGFNSGSDDDDDDEEDDDDEHDEDDEDEEDDD